MAGPDRKPPSVPRGTKQAGCERDIGDSRDYQIWDSPPYRLTDEESKAITKILTKEEFSRSQFQTIAGAIAFYRWGDKRLARTDWNAPKKESSKRTTMPSKIIRAEILDLENLTKALADELKRLSSLEEPRRSWVRGYIFDHLSRRISDREERQITLWKQFEFEVQQGSQLLEGISSSPRQDEEATEPLKELVDTMVQVWRAAKGSGKRGSGRKRFNDFVHKIDDHLHLTPNKTHLATLIEETFRVKKRSAPKKEKQLRK